MHYTEATVIPFLIKRQRRHVSIELWVLSACPKHLCTKYRFLCFSLFEKSMSRLSYCCIQRNLIETSYIIMYFCLDKTFRHIKNSLTSIDIEFAFRRSAKLVHACGILFSAPPTLSFVFRLTGNKGDKF